MDIPNVATPPPASMPVRMVDTDDDHCEPSHSCSIPSPGNEHSLPSIQHAGQVAQPLMHQGPWQVCMSHFLVVSVVTVPVGASACENDLTMVQ